MELEVREMSVELLRELNRIEQLAIALQCIGFSEQEIGEIMHLDKSAVHSKLAGGKAKMRRRLVT